MSDVSEAGRLRRIAEDQPRFGALLGMRIVVAEPDRAVALARQPWGGQPRADFANGRNRLNGKGAAGRTEGRSSGRRHPLFRS